MIHYLYLMKQKQKERRLRLLSGRQGISSMYLPGDKPFSLSEEIEKFEHIKGDQPGKVYHKMLFERLELLELFVELGYTDEEAITFWRHNNLERRKQSKKYHMKPIPVRKDNPNTYGEEFVGFGTKRQPRKCRKTAWKRFSKLFPDHKIK